ncbi:MAG: ABC transporter ATP-binding protein [Lachnospiraceae bacterium]|nr:ABC transporter ATP-binding protein [Lachnospiraceae bacterium]MBR4413693.1 ABC transporter ATP-binding protein [Lachnospiraceae bacterium]MBR5067547.1 ABC transporter ATP-binding protein [Lachnospiraceae bacterium]MBR5916507.1 ABC transporter ATP-binding protein [Lachnospiraceae bacterium]
MIKVNNVSKKYTLKNREIFALKETSFSIEDNKLTVIYGKSGSGKTTLLNIMAGLLPPSNGSVLLDGVDPYLLGDKELSLFRNNNIGYIPQGTSGVSSLTVLENVMLPANIYGVNDIKEKAVSLLKDLGLENLMDSYPAELSGGELRRVSIARAIINSPKMIFADEPTNDLDKENTEFVLKLLKEKSREGMSVVIVSHDEAAMKYADDVIRMGSIQ